MRPSGNLPWVMWIMLAAIGPLAPAAGMRDDGARVLPVTQPATQPTEPSLPTRFEDTPEYSVSKAACELAKARLDAISEDRTRIVAATPEYQTARKAADEAEAILNKARASGSTEERMSASAAFVKAKGALDTIRNNAVNQDPDYRANQAALRKAEATLKDARAAFDKQRIAQEKANASARTRAAALAAAKDPILRGQNEGRVAVGMTQAQVENLYGNGTGIGSTLKGRQVHYTIREANYTYGIVVTYQDDKVSAWTSRATNYPTLRFTGDIPQLTQGMTLDQLQAKLGSNGMAMRESRVIAGMPMLPPPAADKFRPGAAPFNPGENFLQTAYCWKVTLQTRGGIQQQVLTVILADLQVYDYRLGATAE